MLLKGGVAVSRLDDAFDIVRSRPHGHVAAVLGTLRELRLDRMIAGADSPERRRALAMIVARVLDPGSKLVAARGLAEATARDSLALKGGQDRRAGRQGRRQIQDGQALRVGYRRGRVRLSAKA